MTTKVLAIDGPTASGKGTVSAIVAKALGFHYLDSGALYRLCALRCVKKSLDLTDEAACAEEARDMRPEFKDGEITMDGEIVTKPSESRQVRWRHSPGCVLNFSICSAVTPRRRGS